jgi:tetratricopeptide (TPR) repeat protein
MKRTILYIAAIALLWAPHVARADCIKAQELLGKAAPMLEKNPAEAEALYESAASECPRSSAAQYNLGLARYRMRDFAGAEAAFSRSLRLNPASVEAMNGLAMTYISTGENWDRAEAHLERALKMRPGDPTLKESMKSLEAGRKVHDLSGLKKPKPRNNDYAVVVGIERYRDITGVDTAADDAVWVKRYLQDVVGVPEENIVLLLNERATRTDLLKYFTGWLKNNVTTDSTVYIYFAGHGAPDIKTKKAYIVPYDGDPNYLSMTAYPLDSLYDSIAGLPARETVVFLDSCFSGRGDRSVVAEGMRPIALSIENPVLASGRTVVLSAAEGSQASSYYKEAGHGLFTYFLLLGLKGQADSDGDGWVEVGELFTYLKPNVSKHARRINREQTPTIFPPEGSDLELIRLRLSNPG